MSGMAIRSSPQRTRRLDRHIIAPHPAGPEALLRNRFKSRSRTTRHLAPPVGPRRMCARTSGATAAMRAASLEHRPERWPPAFGRSRRKNKNPEYHPGSDIHDDALELLRIGVRDHPDFAFVSHDQPARVCLVGLLQAFVEASFDETVWDCQLELHG